MGVSVIQFIVKLKELCVCCLKNEFSKIYYFFLFHLNNRELCLIFLQPVVEKRINVLRG